MHLNIKKKIYLISEVLKKLKHDIKNKKLKFELCKVIKNGKIKKIQMKLSISLRT